MQFVRKARSPMLGLKTVTAALAAIAALTITVTGAQRSVQVVESGYAASFGDVATSWSPPANSGIWLSSIGSGPPKAHLRLAIGDLVHIAGAQGHLEGIRVTGVTVIDGAGTGLPGTRLQLVTGERLGAEGSTAGAPVRFLFEIDTDVPGTQPIARDKVL